MSDTGTSLDLSSLSIDPFPSPLDQQSFCRLTWLLAHPSLTCSTSLQSLEADGKSVQLKVLIALSILHVTRGEEVAVMSVGKNVVMSFTAETQEDFNKTLEDVVVARNDCKTPDSEKTQAEDWLTRVIAPKVITLFDWAHCQPEGFDDHAANLMYLLRECQNAYHHNPGSQERRDRQFDVHRYVVRACIHKIHTRIAYHSAAATEKAVSCIAFDDFGHLLAPKAGWKLEMEDMLKGLKDFRTSQVSQLLLQRMQVPRSEMMEKDWEALTFKDEELEEACRMPGVAIDGYKEDSIKTAAGRQAVYESFTNYVWRAIFLATLLKQDFFFDKESLKKDTTGDRAGSVSQLFEALSKALLRLSVKIRNPVLQIILQEVLKDAQRNDSARDKAYEEGELEHLEMADLGGMEQLSAYTEKVLRWIALFTQHTACTLFITNSRILRRNHFSADRLVHILETSTSDKLRDQEAKQPYEMVSIPKIISDLGLKLDRVHSEALIRR